MNQFKIESKFKPTGDQPLAIDALTQGIMENKKTSNPIRRYGFGKDLHHG